MPLRGISIYWALLVALLLSASCPALQAQPSQPVTLLLGEREGFRQAGFVMAKALGYYREEGLEVVLDFSPTSRLDRVNRLLSGQADFAIGDTDLLLDYAAGKPVRVIASIFQKSPWKILTQQPAADLASLLHDSANSYQSSSIPPVAFQLIWQWLVEPPQQLNRVWTSQAPLAVAGAPWVASQALLGAQPPKHFLGRHYGLDLYGDLLFTQQAQIRRYPERVDAFVRASLAGWDYALRYPEKTAELLASHPPGQSLQQINAQAREVADLISQELLPLGTMDLERWQQIAEHYRQVGAIVQVDVKGMLYIPQSTTPAWKFYTALMAILLVLFSAICLWRLLILRGEVKRMDQAQFQLLRYVNTDGQTGLENAAQLKRYLQRLFYANQGEEQAYSLLLINIDGMTRINGEYGYQAGEQVLKAMVQRTVKRLRQRDLFARHTKESFAIVLPNTAATGAALIAQRLQEDNRINVVETSQHVVTYSISVAVVSQLATDEAPLAILERAERLLAEREHCHGNLVLE